MGIGHVHSYLSTPMTMQLPGSRASAFFAFSCHSNLQLSFEIE